MNVPTERICPRVDDRQATFGRGERERIRDRCAECGELVVYNPTSGEGPVRLVCLECLVNRPVEWVSAGVSKCVRSTMAGNR